MNLTISARKRLAAGAATGTSACTLAGFPGVSAINKSDHQLGLAAKRARGVTSHTVTVRPGQTAHAMLGITEAGVIGGCHNATAFGLKVYPPNEFTRQFVLSFTFSVCTNKPSMRVYPVRRGIGVP